MNNSEDEPEIQPPEETWKIRFNFSLKILKQIRIEPLIFFHMVSLLVTALAYNDFTLDRICRLDLNFSDETCDALAARQTGNYTEEETAVQKKMAEITTWRFGIEYSVPTILVLFLGAWSDKYGRKFPLILCMAGTILKAISLLICSYFDSWNATIISLWYTIPSSITGSYPLFNMAFYSYIADVSSDEYRTLRFGIAGAFQNIGTAIGSAFGGFLLTKVNLSFRNVFAVSGAIEILVLLATLIIIKNTKGRNDKLAPRVESDSDSLGMSNRKWTSFISIFKIGNIFQTFKILLLRRDSSCRTKLWFYLLVFICSSAPFYGESSMIYLFLRLKLNWNAGEYGIFTLYQTIASIVGVFISAGLLSYYFKLRDATIGFLGCISQISSSFMYAFAESSTMIYSAPVVDILNGAMTLAVRSMATKAVGADEQGKLISIFAGIEAINPVITSVAYAALYRATLEVFPGAIFLLSTTLSIPPFLIYGYFTFVKERRSTKSKCESL